MMQFYKAKVRLAGSTMNEVEKVLSAPEVLVLQFIHGVDAIVNIKKAKRESVDPIEEKARLKARYDQALVKREQSIDTIFGPLGSVPTELPENMVEQFGVVDEDDIISVAKHVTKQDKDRTGRVPQTQIEANRLDNIIPADEVSLDELAG